MSLFRGSMSKIILAHMPARIVKAAYMAGREEAAETGLGRDWEEVKRTLRKIRSDGYSTTHAELDPGVFGVSVPLFDPERAITGSLGFVFSDQDIQLNGLRAMVGWLKQGAGRIEAGLAARIDGAETAAAEAPA